MPSPPLHTAARIRSPNLVWPWWLRDEALIRSPAARLAGAYPNAYGLIGGYSFVMWRHLAGRGTQQYRAFSLIAVLMGIQLVWGVFFETGTMWVAELFGFVCGFGLCFLLAPGEWARIRAKLQRR